MGFAEFMVFSDVFAHVEELPDFNLSANLLQALAAEPFTQGLAMMLAAARKDIKNA